MNSFSVEEKKKVPIKSATIHFAQHLNDHVKRFACIKISFCEYNFRLIIWSFRYRYSIIVSLSRDFVL